MSHERLYGWGGGFLGRMWVGMGFSWIALFT